VFFTCALDRLNQPPPKEEEFERQQHEKLIGQLKYAYAEDYFWIIF